MSRLIHIGFGNIVNTEKIIAIVSPDSAPVKQFPAEREIYRITEMVRVYEYAGHIDCDIRICRCRQGNVNETSCAEL